MELDQLINQVNEEIGRRLDAALAEASACDDPAVRRAYESVYAYLENGGKRLHAISAIVAFRAVGGAPVEAILPVAAGLQLYHHHTLVHDDIYDEDNSRRGSPTLHQAFAEWYQSLGSSPANVRRGQLFVGAAERVGAVMAWAQGKMVHSLAFDSIMSAPFSAEALLKVCRELNRHDLTDNAGQLMDVMNEGCGTLDPATCLEIARIKTGRLFAVGTECAAYLGGATESQSRAISGWIERVATAFQLQDDLSDLDEDSEKGRGRQIGTDLFSLKPTYLMALAQERAVGESREVLRRWFANPGPETESVERVVRALEESQALAECRAKAEQLVSEGKAMLSAALPALPDDEIEFMTSLGDYFLSTSYWKRSLSTPKALFVST